MNRLAAVAADVALAPQPFQQLLHSGIMGSPALRVQPIGDLPNRGRLALPQRLQHRQLSIGDVLRGPCHVFLPHQTICLSYNLRHSA